MKAPARQPAIVRSIVSDERSRGRGEELARCKQVLSRMGLPPEWLDPSFGEYLERGHVQLTRTATSVQLTRHTPASVRRRVQKTLWMAGGAGMLMLFFLLGHL